MRLILSSVLILFLNTALATSYYFSASSGDDSRSSSQATNSSTPWKTINKLNSFFGKLQPGDQILFKRGDTFFGTITITKSGTSGAPIVIGAYGSGSDPVITGLVTLSGWTANSKHSGVYECSANSSFSKTLNLLLFNGQQKGMGRYPNTDKSNGGYLTLESHSGNNSITDKELTSSPNWTGAEVVIRTVRWRLDRSLITAHSGGTLTYNNPGGSSAWDDYGYFIQNDVRTLDQLGEWYYNPGTKKISVYFGGNSPSSYSVKAAAKDNLIYSYNVSNIKIQDLALTGANAQSVSLNNGSNIKMQNCQISFSGTDGIFGSSSNSSIESCTVTNSNNDGIDVSSGNGFIVRNNVIKNSYTIIGMGQSGNGQGGGIRNCVNGLVEYNQVLNSGYVGIQMGSNNSIIRYNLVDNFGFVKDDGGGIYTSNGLNKTNSGRVIHGNIIINGIGAPDGTNGPNTSSADGIYFDDNTNGVEITDNTIANCNAGIYLHNSRNIIVRNNTFYNSKRFQLYMKHDALGDPLKDHVLANNIFFSKELTQLTASVSSISNDLSSAGKIDSNYYARPIDDETTIYSGYTSSSGSEISGVYDLKGWKGLYNFDSHSKKSAKQIAAYKITSTSGSNKVPTGAFNSSADIEKVWANSSSLAWNNSGALDGAYLKVSPTNTSSSIVVYVGALSTSKKYVLRYSVKGTGNMSIAANLRASSYEPITYLKYWTVSTSRDDNEMLFTPTKNESGASVVFTVDAKQVYYIDNIQLYEASATTTNPDDSIRFVYNASKSSKSLSLGGNYVDVKNNKYSGSITLKPYSSAVLISDGGSTTNAAPTVSITSPTINASFSAPSDVGLTASASDNDGTISKVEFYNGSTLITTENDAPYEWTWKGLSEGNYTITAKATDNSGNVTTSSPVSFTVGSADKPPVVDITSPTVDASYADPASVRLIASASDQDGSISKVEFYNGNDLIATENYAPYEWTWNNVPAGTYSITAKATDNSGNVTTSSVVKFSVGSATSNTAPVVSITSPSSTASYSGPSSVQLTASASDPDGSIAKVEFYNGNTLLTIERYGPYDWTWQSVQPGDYVITAKAYDNSGNVTTSAPVVFSISGTFASNSNSAPAVAITSPAIEAYYTAVATVNIAALASDPDGSIQKVEFYSGGQLMATENYAPYSWDWNKVGSGNYTITAKAYDNSGNVTTSAPVSFTVRDPLTVTIAGQTTQILSSTNSPSSNNTGTTDQSANTVANNKIQSPAYSKGPADPLSVTLYPNPAITVVNLKLASGFHTNEKATLTVTNSSGSVFKKAQVALSGSIVVDISALNPGMYILNLSNENFTISKQFLKMKN